MTTSFASWDGPIPPSATHKGVSDYPEDGYGAIFRADGILTLTYLPTLLHRTVKGVDPAQGTHIWTYRAAEGTA